MANMNEAYDLELFKPREPQLVALEKNPKAARDRHKRARAQTVTNVIVYLLVAVVVMALVGYFITGNVQLTEINKAIGDCQTELNTLQSERVRLEADLAAKTAADQVEQYAIDNGMLPADSGQIYYISSGEEDLVTLPQDGAGWLRRAWQAICDIFS